MSVKLRPDQLEHGPTVATGAIYRELTAELRAKALKEYRAQQKTSTVGAKISDLTRMIGDLSRAARPRVVEPAPEKMKKDAEKASQLIAARLLASRKLATIIEEPATPKNV